MAIFKHGVTGLDWIGRAQVAGQIWDLFFGWLVGPKLLISSVWTSAWGIATAMIGQPPVIVAFVGFAAFVLLLAGWASAEIIRDRRRARVAVFDPKPSPERPEKAPRPSPPLPVGEPDPDCLVYDALVYTVLGRWPLTDDERNPENYGNLGGKLFHAARDLRNHARRGRLDVWGREWPHDLPVQIPKEYWQHFEICWETLLRRKPEALRTKFSSTGARRAPIYQHLETFRAQVEHLWSRATLVNAALIDLGDLREKAVHFRESRGETLSEGELGWIREWESAVKIKVNIVSPADLTFFRVLNKVDESAQPASALKNDHLLWLSARIDHVERIIRENKDKHAV